MAPGDWSGEILGECSVHFGQIFQQGPPRKSVELSYVILPAALITSKLRFVWPGIIMLVAPTPMRRQSSDGGRLLRAENVPSLCLSLEATRHQFSDVLRMVEAKRVKTLYLTVEEGTKGSCPIYSWSIVAHAAL